MQTFVVRVQSFLASVVDYDKGVLADSSPRNSDEEIIFRIYIDFVVESTGERVVGSDFDCMQPSIHVFILLVWCAQNHWQQRSCRVIPFTDLPLTDVSTDMGPRSI